MMPKKPEEEKPESASGSESAAGSETVPESETASESASSPYAPASPTTEPSVAVPPVVPPVAPPVAVPPAYSASASTPPGQPAAGQPPAGQPPAPAYYGAPAAYQAGPQKPPTTLSLLAMIFGIVGVALACCYGAGFLFAVAGVVLGHLGRKREAAQGMALTGLITGYAGAALSLIMWVLLFILALSPLLFLPFLTDSSL